MSSALIPRRGTRVQTRCSWSLRVLEILTVVQWVFAYVARDILSYFIFYVFIFSYPRCHGCTTVMISGDHFLFFSFIF